MKAIFHPEAHEEMIQSALFYVGKSEALGSDFRSRRDDTPKAFDNLARRITPG